MKEYTYPAIFMYTTNFKSGNLVNSVGFHMLERDVIAYGVMGKGVRSYYSCTLSRGVEDGRKIPLNKRRI